MSTCNTITTYSNDAGSNKVFVVGLPRTGTTSFCAAMLEMGFSVAHTAYTKSAFQQAQVIADTPIFCDFQHLSFSYPNAKFVYLNRALEKWLPSIKQLLNRMYSNVVREDGGFNPHIKRCYQSVFSPFTLENINNDEFLSRCYLAHKHLIIEHFSSARQPSINSAKENNAHRLLELNISDSDAISRLQEFLSIPPSEVRFSHLNIGGKVTAWKDIKHPLKVESTNNGRIDKSIY